MSTTCFYIRRQCFFCKGTGSKYFRLESPLVSEATTQLYDCVLKVLKVAITV